MKFYRVKLSCGCSFRESRPEGMRPPVDGELRSCGHPKHYTGTNIYNATYEALPDQEWSRE